jgi:protein required for attachment to host cells
VPATTYTLSFFQDDEKMSIYKHSKKKQTIQYHPLCCKKKPDQRPSPKQRQQQSFTLQNKKNVPDKEDSENSSNASEYSQSSSSTVKIVNAQQEMEIDMGALIMLVKPPLIHKRHLISSTKRHSKKSKH